MRVVIARDGIGGLATALMVHEAGIDCQVYEWSAAIRELGVGMLHHLFFRCGTTLVP
ncbi:MAG TPA: hypothetical protein VH637_16670 [Streptosporangiaceae bacterium]|jgi:2-polyprenyl-6-methoxyphenol hydroxylase-like FAD-dependent oxidoreductase